jgi:asparagine synthase (glutamine-hydrolysing)
MCGIAGFVNGAEGNEFAGRVLGRMMETLRHRGPDDSGVYQDEVISLGHRRLSVIDLAGGHQPMSNEDATLWVIYNGEIFNHAALRPELERAGHRYRTNSDTETILHAWEQYGPDCVLRFRGMFAFAIWDARARTLFCARDRLGIKPFYYVWRDGWFGFASEIKALFEHPRVSPALNESALGEHLAFGYTSDEGTLFAGVRKLMPGHHLLLRLDGERTEPKIARYWDIVAQPSGCGLVAQPSGCVRDEDWIAECRQRVEETVRMRLMSDVPLGMFLSGGVDSSVIAALMKRMVPGPVVTFSVGYRESEYSELDYARRVARWIGSEHREVVLGRDEFFNALPRLIWHEDEPITWPSSVSLYFVSRLASEHVKVVLTGEGSDELFAGYSRYRFHGWNSRWARRYGVLPAALRRRIRQWIAGSSLLGAGARRKLGHTFLGCGDSLESLYLDNFYCAFSPAAQQELLTATQPEGCATANFRRYFDAGDRSPLERLLYADQKTYLVELLMKQDRMSMATSIESRVPLLDHPLVEFAARLPGEMKLRGTTGKYIFKKAAEGLVPREILYRRKMGFPTPLRSWLRDAAATPLFDLLRAPDGLLGAYVDRRALENLIHRHRSGAEDATDRIWRLLNLQLWGEIFLAGRREKMEAGLVPSGPAGARVT